MSVLALVHSPLTGPLVWSLLGEELSRRGVESTVPEVADHPSARTPFWEQHARSVARSLRRVPEDRDLVLVAHSGAGPLLPAVRQFAARPAAGYLFVDAPLPQDGASRLEQFRKEDPEWAAELERHLADGGRFPEWSEDDLQKEIPAAGLRRGLVRELRPRPLSFFTEPISVFTGWPDAPCGYLRLSPPYDPPLRRARDGDWPTRSVDAGHFHMLVDPAGVAGAILELLDEMKS